MNKLSFSCPSFWVVLWLAIPFFLQAQFNSGVASLTEAKLIHKAWHLNSKLPGNSILSVSGGTAWANDHVIDNASTFVIEPGPDDGDWWTADKRWFYLRNAATGLYLSVQGSSLPRSVGLEPYSETALAQKFRLIPTVDPGWYKLRSHLSTGINNPDLVLEINANGQLIADSPKVDPSAEQKFAFNLALPKAEFRYSVINAHNGQYISDNGISTAGNFLVHKKEADQSCILKFIPVPGNSPYYYLRAELTGYNASNYQNSSIKMNGAVSVNDFKDHWEILRAGENYTIRNRFNNYYIVKGSLNASGDPLILNFSAPVPGGEWVISPVPEEPTIVTDDYERIEDAQAPILCSQTYGINFKKALAERIGLNPDHAGQHFQFIQDALAAKYGADRVAELLQKFELDNPGHRADLGMAVRYYITEVLAGYHPDIPWPAPAQAAIAEWAAKIQALRINYAQRLQTAWANHLDNHQNAATGFSALFYSVSDDGFLWPTMYNPQGSQAALIEEYTTAADAFGDFSPPSLGGGLTGLSAALGAIHIIYGPSLIQATSFVQVTGHFSVGASTAAANASVPASTIFSASVAPIGVAITAISMFAIQLTAGLELQDFLDSFDDKLTWAQMPINFRSLLTGPHKLETIRLLSDLDFVIGAPVTGSFLFNVNDNVNVLPFDIQCPSTVTLNLNAQGSATLTTELILANQPLIIPNCGGPMEYFIASQTQYDCGDLGMNNNIYFVARNEIATDVPYVQVCTLAVLVVDPILPAVTCKNATVALNGSGNVTITPGQVFLSGADNCGALNLQSVTPATFNCANLGIHAVQLKVNDGNGNEKTCQATVTVVDNTAPSAICPPVPIAIELDANGQETLLPSQLGAASTDNCQASLTFTMSQTTFTCADVGVNTETLTVKDASNNIASCQVSLIIGDHVKPTALCKTATVLLDATGTGTLAPADVDDGSSDACGISSRTLSKTSFGCADVGTVTVTLTVKDIFHNEKTCTANIQVVDNINPIALCKNATVQLDASGSGSTSATAVDNGSSDACGIQSLVLSKTNFDCSNVGANTVTLTVTDNNNNAAGCSSTITVVDEMPPTISCPANRVLSNDPGDCSAVVDYEVTAADNCSSIVAQIGGYGSGQPFPIGTTTNAFSATDAVGNEASCSFTVTVNKFGDPDLLYAYSIIGMGDVKLKNNTIGAGGIGVVNAGKKVRLEQGTQVSSANSFVMAPQLDLQGGSSAQVYYQGTVDASLLPMFIPNNNPGNNNLNIPDNSAPVILGLGSYGKLEIGKNVTATLSGPASVFVKELKLKEDATLLFAQNTEVHIDKKMDLAKNSTIDKGNHTVWIYVEDGVSVSEGCDITANIFTQKDISAAKAKVDNQTYMAGLFIAEGVDAKEFVNWNWDEAQCPFTPPLNLSAGILHFNAQLHQKHEELRVDLNWITNTGLDDLRYEVEKSPDGIHFAPVLETGSRYEDRHPHYYNNFDAVPEEGNWFYRLKIVRKDGSVDYTGPHFLNIQLPENLTVFPNPTSSDINVSLKSLAGKAAVLKVFNSQGVLIREERLKEVPLYPLHLQLNGIKDGMYWLNVQAEGYRDQRIRFVLNR